MPTGIAGNVETGRHLAAGHLQMAINLNADDHFLFRQPDANVYVTTATCSRSRRASTVADETRSSQSIRGQIGQTRTRAGAAGRIKVGADGNKWPGRRTNGRTVAGAVAGHRAARRAPTTWRRLGAARRPVRRATGGRRGLGHLLPPPRRPLSSSQLEAELEAGPEEEPAEAAKAAARRLSGRRHDLSEPAGEPVAAREARRDGLEAPASGRRRRQPVHDLGGVAAAEETVGRPCI